MLTVIENDKVEKFDIETSAPRPKIPGDKGNGVESDRSETAEKNRRNVQG